ncbi:MAG: hypothetical protein FWG25_05540, partial [Promicromonosporaceae bacterium]|nr:hypothetical protein [Promicromonosporaceae bacterium]
MDASPRHLTKILSGKSAAILSMALFSMALLGGCGSGNTAAAPAVEPPASPVVTEPPAAPAPEATPADPTPAATPTADPIPASTPATTVRSVTHTGPASTGMVEPTDATLATLPQPDLEKLLPPGIPQVPPGAATGQVATPKATLTAAYSNI